MELTADQILHKKLLLNLRITLLNLVKKINSEYLEA